MRISDWSSDVCSSDLVGARISAYDLGLVLLARCKRNEDAVGLGDHMVVGKNIAVFGNDEARADSTRNRTLLLLADRRNIALTRAGCDGRHAIRAEAPAEHTVGMVAVVTHARYARRPAIWRTT